MMPITRSSGSRSRIPIHADHLRSEATLFLDRTESRMRFSAEHPRVVERVIAATAPIELQTLVELGLSTRRIDRDGLTNELIRGRFVISVCHL